jgi:mono/diheme cytochrome c family protein
LAFLAGCRSDMQDQPRLKPLRRSDFFPDGRSARPLVAGTVARGELHEDRYFYTGFIGKSPGDYLPFPATREVLERGRERFNIYCAPCHARKGDGNGMIVQRGYRRPPSYHTDRLRAAPLGHFFDVMTNGFGAMPDYAQQVPPPDRWAIAAYIRVLQFSQNAPASLVPSGTQLPSPVPPATGMPGSGAAPVQAAPASGNLPAAEPPPSPLPRKDQKLNQKQEQEEPKLGQKRKKVEQNKK